MLKYRWGRCRLEGFGTWPLEVRMVKGHQHRIFLDNSPFTFERVPVFRFQSCPSPFVPWRGETLVLGVEVKIFSSARVSHA